MAKEAKVGIYARVSTDHKGQTPETQLIELRKYCHDRDWPYTEYTDVGTSGATMDRPALNRLQKDIHWHRVNTVIIWKFDRLARNTRELLNLADDWGKRGVDLISTTEKIDTTSPGGRAIFAIMAVIAEFERAVLVERVNAGLARARHEGTRLGRPKTKVHIPPVILNAVQDGAMSVYQAAKATGIPRTTLKRRLAARGIVTKKVEAAPKVGISE
jgi:DNA invertase Pin-like site-specific DNA recombinase